jgi:glycosyltransferase involved in cell wall biosynthesis
MVLSDQNVREVAPGELKQLVGRRLLISEERLKDMNGHFFEWNKSVRKIHEQAGVRVDVYAHRGVQPYIRDELKAVPHFHDTLPDQEPDRNRVIRFLKFLFHSNRAYRQAKQALVQCGPVDTVLVSTTPDHQLLAWSQICAESLGRQFKRLVLFFIMGQARYMDYNPQPRFSRRAGLYRRILRRFAPAVNAGKVLLCSDSDQTVEEYSLLGGVPFVEIPCPRTSPAASERALGEPITIASLGPPRAEKGAEELVEAIEILRRMTLPRPVRFLVHWPCDFVNEQGRQITIPASWESDPRVALIRKFLNTEEYEKTMMACDCLVLPYRWSSYFNRISGVVVEAATAGIPIVVVENTWLDRAQQHYGAGLACKDRNAADMAQKIAEACEGIEELWDRARTRASVAKAHHAPERFLRLLWGLSA